jgi:chromosome segregation ATPase
MSSNANNQVDLEMGSIRSPSPPGTPNAVLADLRAQLTALLQLQSAKLDGIPNEASVSNLLQTQISPILARTGNIEQSLEEFKASVAELLNKYDGLQTDEIPQLALAMVQKAEQHLISAEVPKEDWLQTKAYADIVKILVDIRKAELDIKKTESDIKKAEKDIEKADVEMRKAEADIKKADADTRKAESDIKKNEVEIREKEANIERMKSEIRRGWTTIIVAVLAFLVAFFGSAGFARFVLDK